MLLSHKRTMMPASVLLLIVASAVGRILADESSYPLPNEQQQGAEDTGKEETDWNGGKDSCPCLTLEEAGVANLPTFESPYLYYKDKGESYPFSETYGSEVCAAHDNGNAPFCEKDDLHQFPGNPDWCRQPWCWVDPQECRDARFHKSQFFPESSLYYSYDTCGGSNTFAAWIGATSTTEHSFTDLIGLVERYVVSTKTTLEAQSNRIQSFVSSASPTSIAAECSPLPACGDCRDCRSNVGCWNRPVNFEATTTILSPTNRMATSQEELDTLACQTNSLSRSFLQVSGREYNNENRIAYAYHGDQNTGALVQWPAIGANDNDDSCADNYDARFRPWYASALSGSKDIVLVIDVSGSMDKNQRILLAAKAAKAVLQTLTWVDYFTIITFNDVVKSVYAGGRLERATQDALAKAMQWIDQEVQADGGTNFLDPLQTAYQILSRPAAKSGSNNDNDPARCSQAILFLTAGEDSSFAVEALETERNANPNVVTFTYSLGAEAATTILQELACASNGIFHRVQNEQGLPDVMAAYYEYFVQLQDSCHFTWIQYTGAFTDQELLSGCAPVFDYSSSDEELPKVMGVTCLDLNLIVDLETLQSCTSGGYDDFVRVVRQEAQECSSRRVMDYCVLAHLRERAGSSCPDAAAAAAANTSVATCTLPPQPTTSDCSNLNPQRFQDIPLSGCSSSADPHAACPTTPISDTGGGGGSNQSSGPTLETETSSSGDGLALAVGIVILLLCCVGGGVAIALVVFCCCMGNRARSNATNQTTSAKPVPAQKMVVQAHASPPAAVKVEASTVQGADESVRTVPDDLRILPPPSPQQEQSVGSFPSNLQILPPPTAPTDSVRATW